ncbi:hypothetical protein N7499_011849 [Penicillium canescens]|nr:hypothetical protein N7499_011849 [Penicillium canescens]KAJ6181987.1 hypothetical protein N7485_000629 [Penicillium canescens]
MVASTDPKAESLYIYTPSHILPAVFAALVAASFLLHVYQNYRYRFWRVTFFLCWGGAVFTAGWILRCISSYHPDNLNIYIASSIFIYAGPPIYSAAAYNIVGRLMNYLPMHALLNPNRVLIFFVYLGAAVEAMTAAGAAKNLTADGNIEEYETGGALIAAGLVLQAAVECCVISVVATVHARCSRASMLSPNVRILCITLYGTSTLVLLRCIFRAVEAFEMFKKIGCRENCGSILSHEWYLYAFELGPMLIFTWWMNVFHPGRNLPRQKNRYLSPDGRTERMGPGWIDRRSTWETFADPLDLGGMIKGKPSHEEYWLREDEWPVCKDGSFAVGTATNTRIALEDQRELAPLSPNV